MKVLVTGSGGFVGRHLVEALHRWQSRPGIFGISKVVGVSRRATTYPWDIKFPPTGPYDFSFTYEDRLQDIYCDLTSEQQVASLMKRYDPDVVFHFAGNPLIRTGSCDISNANIMTTHYLLEHCSPGTRFVFASSAAVYGDLANHPMPECGKTDVTSVYGATKLASEALIRAYKGKVNSLILRLVANVGPGATHGVVKDLVAKLRTKSEYLELLGDEPGSIKHYTHVDDTVSAAVKFGMNSLISGIVNVANDDQISIDEVAWIVRQNLGIYKPVKWLGQEANWKGDNRVVRVDNSRAKNLGWTPAFPCSKDAVAKAVQQMGAK